VCHCTEIDEPQGLWLRSDGTYGNASFVTTQPYPITYGGSGSAKVDLFLTKCTTTVPPYSCWHYITIPVQSATAGVILNNPSVNQLRYFNEPTGTWIRITNPAFVLNPMQGYAVSNMIADATLSFVGLLNDGTVSISPLTRTVSYGSGWNLVGNPYPSEIDLNTLQTITPPEVWTSNVDKIVYYINRVTGGYYKYYINTGTGDVGSTQYAPSMVGFFVHVSASELPNGSLAFTDDNRTTTGTVNFYKPEPQQANLLLLNVEDKNGINDQAVIQFRQDASQGFDQNIDFEKMLISLYEGVPQLYAVSADNHRLDVNALPLDEKYSAIPVGFNVTGNLSGEYTMTAGGMESFQAGTRITLEDKKTSTSQVMSDNPVYTFSYSEGDNPDRFMLHFYNPCFGVDDKTESKGLMIYSNSNNLYVESLKGIEVKGHVKVYNLFGQRVAEKILGGGVRNKFSMNLETGYYIVEVMDNEQVYHGKIYLTR
jgi:hypothetical protein